MEGTYNFNADGVASPVANVPSWSLNALRSVQAQFEAAKRFVASPEVSAEEAAAAIASLRDELSVDNAAMEKRLQRAFIETLDSYARDLKGADGGKRQDVARKRLLSFLVAVAFILGVIADTSSVSELAYDKVWPLVMPAFGELNR